MPPPVLFQLGNGSAASVFIYERCILDLTITDLSDPQQAIGRLDGCPVCECQTSCQPVTCGACFDGGLEVAPGATQAYDWSPVDVSFETQGGATCANTRVLSAGHYLRPAGHGHGPPGSAPIAAIVSARARPWLSHGGDAGAGAG